MNILEKLQADRSIDVQFWGKHPELKKQLVDDAYPDKAHFIFELLQNAEDAYATRVDFYLFDDRLEFRHNGKRIFTESDIDAITDVSKSGKPDTGETIGKFGIGFKSVFKYTETPEIYSGDYSFRIFNFVYPEAVPAIESLGADTLFRFPFNSSRKLPSAAYDEIANGLTELASATLLFLRNLRSIGWKLSDYEVGVSEIERIEHPDGLVEIQKRIDRQTVETYHFLRYSEPVTALPKQQVAIAFALEFLNETKSLDTGTPLFERVRIVPAVPAHVSVFFPAEDEESGLRFHLHAPFVPVLSRASIKDTEANEPLFEQLATLTAKSLYKIRDQGLLNTDFLGVVPNNNDILPEKYQVIRTAIIAEMNEYPLTPTYSRSHAPAKHLLQAKASLKEMLSAEDIEFLIEYNNEPPQWAVGASQKNSDQDRFLGGLSIRKWDIDDFMALLIKKAKPQARHIPTPPYFSNSPDQDFMAWLGTKAPDWHQELYSLLYYEITLVPEIFRPHKYGKLKDLEIVRLADGQFSSGAKSFFPSEGLEQDETFPIVDSNVYSSGKSKPQQAAARALLEAIGVRPIGEADLVKHILQTRYSPPAFQPDIADLVQFVALVEKDPTQGKLFKDFHIFKRTDDKWGLPSQVFLDTPFMETGLTVCFGAVSNTATMPLSVSYIQATVSTERLLNFAVAVGVATGLPISRASCYQNPESDRLVWTAPGGWSKTYGKDSDYTVAGLEQMLTQKNVEISKVVWKTLCANKNHNILIAEFRNNSQCHTRTAPSQLVYLLKHSEWVPQGDGEFRRPSQASRALLPEGFPFDAGDEWLKAVCFGEEENLRLEEEAKYSLQNQEKLQAAKGLGFQDADTFERAKRFANMPPDEQERILAQFEAMSRQHTELPEHASSNPELRAERVTQQADEAPERTAEKRERSVSLGLGNVKNDAEQYLRNFYTNSNGEMICQICRAPLPFKLDGGEYYFEAVEFLSGKDSKSGLRRRHYQNYLALCPNHGAMFRYANGTAELMKDMLVDLKGNVLEIILAQDDASIYFTKTHIADLQAVILADSGSCDQLDSAESTT
jgi:hypothetical protein